MKEQADMEAPSRSNGAERPRPAPSSATPAVTQERLKAILDSRGWNWFVDNEGDLGGIWDGNTFYFMLVGQEKSILQIYGTFNRSISMERLDEVREFILAWHHDKLWPKVAHRVTDSGELRIQVENTVDWQYGASDAQLLQHIDCALGTAGGFFDALIERLGL